MSKITGIDLVGQKVHAWTQDEPITLHAIENGPFETMRVGAGGVSVITSFDRVAPADTPIPAKDDRVIVTKGTTRDARAAGHYGRGSWMLDLPGRRTTWHNTKSEATLAGLRRVAILDWHAANEA